MSTLRSRVQITGSIGDMLFFHSYKKDGMTLDLIGDIRELNMKAMKAKHTGAIIIGGGVVKHHIMNANLMRNGKPEPSTVILVRGRLQDPNLQDCLVCFLLSYFLSS